MKKLFYLLTLYFAVLNCKAQRLDWNEDLDSNFYNVYLKPADNIFEATIEKIEVTTEGDQYFGIYHLKVHKIFKGVLPSKSIIYKTEIDSSKRARILKYDNSEGKYNNYTFNGWTELYIGSFPKNQNSKNDLYSTLIKSHNFSYFLNFDTYTYKDQNYLIKDELRFGAIPRKDSSEVDLPYPYHSLNKVSELYDFLLKQEGISLSFDDGTAFRQKTTREWLDEHPGMRPNIYTNKPEPIPPVQINKPTDPELLKQNAEDFKKALEFRKKMSKPLSPKEKRKRNKELKKLKKNNGTLSYFIKN